ncbi:MAG: choice-of-anchor D domain-containing protein [Chlorobi bacterium]|nr:choice-of-anchor D domain-containing protein [Chlorobiota bacterium]
MKKIFSLLVVLIALLSMSNVALKAQLYNNYSKIPGKGTPLDVSGGTEIFPSGTGYYDRQGTWPTVPIPFNFSLDCRTYTRVGVAQGGYMELLNSATYYNYAYGYYAAYNYNGGATITSITDYMFVQDGGVVYKTIGSAPNRIFIVEWNIMPYDQSPNGNRLGGTASKTQIRLYETSNKIEIFANTGGYQSPYNGYNDYFANVINPSGISPNTIGCTTPLPNFTFTTYYVSWPAGSAGSYPPDGTLITYAPPLPVVIGNIPTAPSTTPTTVDELMSSTPAAGTVLYNTTLYSGTTGATPSPITLGNGGLSARTYTFSITRDASIANGEYQFVPGCFTTSGTVLGVSVSSVYNPTFGTFETNNTLTATVYPGGSITPCISFTPTCGGTRKAIFNASDGCSQGSYLLRAVGADRVTISDPGIDLGRAVGPLGCGAALMDGRVNPGYQVNFGSFGTFAPVRFFNSASSPLVINSAEIMGAGRSQYQFSTSGTASGPWVTTPAASVTIPAGGTFVWYIKFTPDKHGCRPASLQLKYDCITCEFNLYGVGAGKAATFSVDGVDINDGRFAGYATTPEQCSQEMVTIPINLSNYGTQNVNITDLKVYALETGISQGSPQYALSSPLKSVSDYFVTTNTPISPTTSPLNLLVPGPTGVYSALPNIQACKSDKILYLTFSPTLAGKRYARIFLQTDATNFSGKDANGVVVPGMLNLDLYGKGTGAFMSDIAGKRPGDVMYPDTKVGMESKKTITFYNSGKKCDLQITKIWMTSGDVDDVKEFNMLTDISKPFTVKAGGSITLDVSFMPQSIGTRYAIVNFRTNDATDVNTALDEKGVVRVRLIGKGLGTLIQGDDTDFGTLVENDEQEKSRKIEVNYHNPELKPSTIVDVTITGANASDFGFTKVSLPKQILPGDDMKVLVEFAPKSGVGMKVAELNIIMSNGNTYVYPLNGEVGTRVISVKGESNPLAFGNLGVKQVSRRTVMLMNTGSVALTLTSMKVSGADASSFTLGKVARLVLDPGMSIPLEISMMGTTTGAKSAKFEVMSDGTNGTQEIMLQGLVSNTIKSDNSGKVIK